eukprot:scaffold59739_cov71-Phaeocystis_antarctica.AAC.4
MSTAHVFTRTGAAQAHQVGGRRHAHRGTLHPKVGRGANLARRGAGAELRQPHMHAYAHAHGMHVHVHVHVRVPMPMSMSMCMHACACMCGAGGESGQPLPQLALPRRGGRLPAPPLDLQARPRGRTEAAGYLWL